MLRFILIKDIDKVGENMTKKAITLILFALIMIVSQTSIYAAKDTGLWKNINVSSDNKADSSASDGGDSISIEDMDPDNWKPTSTTVTSGTEKIQNIGNKIIGPIRVLGSIISVVTLIIIGIKYILGSVEEKAEYKKTMLPYLIGAVMIFAITNLLKIIIDIIGGF